MDFSTILSFPNQNKLKLCLIYRPRVIQKTKKETYYIF